MELERVADGIDRWVMPEASMNAYVIADGGEALIVDPGTLPSRAVRLREAVEARGDRIIGVIITHAHWDHFLALSAFEGIPAFAHPTAIDHILEHPTEHLAAGIASLGGEDGALLERSRVMAPDVPVAELHRLTVGAVGVILDPQETAHTTGDLLVHVGADVTITGDLVEADADPQWDDTSDLDGWTRALDVIDEHGATTLLPGHGSPVGPARLEHHRALFAASAGGRP